MKKLYLFIIFCFTLTAITACNNGSAQNSNGKLPTSDYPPAPPSIMLAELTRVDGSKFKLADHKGKVLLVNLWATWCGPCLQEMPEFVKLQQEHKDKGFVIVGIDADEGEDAELIKEFAHTMGLNYELTLGSDKLSEDFRNVTRFNGIPQTFLIDREGRLVGIFVGGGKNIAKIVDAVNKMVVQ